MSNRLTAAELRRIAGQEHGVQGKDESNEDFAERNARELAQRDAEGRELVDEHQAGEVEGDAETERERAGRGFLGRR